MKKITTVLLVLLIGSVLGFYQDWEDKEAIATIPVVEEIVYPECGFSMPAQIDDFELLLDRMAKTCRFMFANYNELSPEHYNLLKLNNMVVAVNFRSLVFFKSTSCVDNCLEYNRDKLEGECLYPDWKERVNNWVADNDYLLDSDVFKWFNPHDEANNGCAGGADLQTIIDELSSGTVLNMPVALSYEGGEFGGDMPATLPTGADCVHLFQNINKELSQSFQDSFDFVKQTYPGIIVGSFISHVPFFDWEPTKEDIEFVIDDRKQFCMDNLPNCLIVVGAAPSFSPQGNTALNLNVDLDLLHPVYPLSFPEFTNNAPVPTPAPTPMPTPIPTPIPTPEPFSPGVIADATLIAGQNTNIVINNASPFSEVHLLWGFNNGSTPVCNGSSSVQILSARTDIHPVQADGSGQAIVGIFIPASGVGVPLRFQAVTSLGSNCGVTNLIAEVIGG